MRFCDRGGNRSAAAAGRLGAESRFLATELPDPQHSNESLPDSVQYQKREHSVVAGRGISQVRAILRSTRS